MNQPCPLDGSRGLGPYHFSLQAIVVIAPTDGQYQPTKGPVVVQDNYFIMHGSADGDVWPFEGYQTYNRAHPIDLNAPTRTAKGWKALLWIYGANHNFFNSVWPQEGKPSLSRTEQETIAKVYISAIAHGLLLGQPQYLQLLKDARWGQQQVLSQKQTNGKVESLPSLFLSSPCLLPPCSNGGTFCLKSFCSTSGGTAVIP